MICEVDNNVCKMKCVVYKGICVSCEEFYTSETRSPPWRRMDEYLGALRNPQSYP